MRTLSGSNPVARKNYGCDACTWLIESVLSYGEVDSYDFTFSELRAIVTARKNGYRIMKGEKHIQATIVSCEGTLISWRAITDIDEICLEHDLYPEEEVC